MNKALSAKGRLQALRQKAGPLALSPAGMGSTGSTQDCHSLKPCWRRHKCTWSPTTWDVCARVTCFSLASCPEAGTNHKVVGPQRDSVPALPFTGALGAPSVPFRGGGRPSLRALPICRDALCGSHRAPTCQARSRAVKCSGDAFLVRTDTT